jgi:hypothetical protein
MYRLRPALLLLSSSILLAQVATEPGTNSHPYTMLYVFGDSYSDSGAGYVDADGPTAVVYLAQRLGILFTFNGDPGSGGKGLNFAVSAASAGEGAARPLASGGALGFGMKNQIESFVRYLKDGTIPKIDAANTIGFVRTNIESEIGTLYELGARRFMVAILPVKIPSFRRRWQTNEPGARRDSRRGAVKARGHPHR